MPMAFSSSALQRAPSSRAIAAAMVLALFGVLAVTHFHHVDESLPPTEELAQTSVSVEAEAGFVMPPPVGASPHFQEELSDSAEEVDPAHMPPLPNFKNFARDNTGMEDPAPNLKLQKEGEKAFGSLKKNLSADGEDKHPSPANQGLKDLNAKIAAKDPIAEMPPVPQMPPSIDRKTEQKEKNRAARLKTEAAANQADTKHPESTVDEAEKALDKTASQLKKPTKIDTKVVSTGTPGTVTTVPHTTKDPTCCDKWNTGAALYIVRKDKCDLAKACHARCQHPGHECYCCKKQ